MSGVRQPKAFRTLHRWQRDSRNNAGVGGLPRHGEGALRRRHHEQQFEQM